MSTDVLVCYFFMDVACAVLLRLEFHNFGRPSSCGRVAFVASPVGGSRASGTYGCIIVSFRAAMAAHLAVAEARSPVELAADECHLRLDHQSRLEQEKVGRQHQRARDLEEIETFTARIALLEQQTPDVAAQVGKVAAAKAADLKEEARKANMVPETGSLKDHVEK